MPPIAPRGYAMAIATPIRRVKTASLKADPKHRGPDRSTGLHRDAPDRPLRPAPPTGQTSGGIHRCNHAAFAGVATRKNALILTLKSDSDVASSRIMKHQQTSANRWHLEI